MRRRATRAAAIGAAVLMLAPRPAGAAAYVLNVVATLPGLAAIAHEVGGKHVRVQALASAQEDPHFVEPRPTLMLALNRADLLVANGLDLEVGWLPPLQRSARNARIQLGGPGYVEAAQFVAALEVPQGKIDRSMGDLHAGGNPHFLNGPTSVQRIAHGLAARLAAADPAHADAYRDNATVFARAVKELAARQRRAFAELPVERRRAVAYHKSLAYLFDWLDLEEVGTIEPRPGVPPDPKHIKGLLGVMRQRGARLVVQEGYYPAGGISRTLARMANGALVVIPGAVNFAAHQDYLDYLADIAERLRAAAAPPPPPPR